MVAAALVAALLIARLLRPTTIRAIFSGELPRPKSVTAWGHKVEFLEQEVEAGTALDTRRDQQLEALERRVEKMVLVLRKYGQLIDAHRYALDVLLDENTEDDDEEGDRIGGK